MLETQDLALIQAVVAAGTLRGASDLAHLSQPAITRRLQTLQSRVGVSLFQRSGRRLQLTEAGEEFVRRSEEILGKVRDLEAEMSAFGRGQRGVLRIGATTTVCLYLLAPALRTMRARYPEYELFLVNETSRRMPDLVREGAVDVGIASIGGRLKGLRVCPWRELHLGVLTQGEEAAGPVPIRALEGAPLVSSSPGSLRTAVDEALRAYEVHPRIAAQADSLEVVRMLVSAGFGSAVVPQEVMAAEALANGLAIRPFAEPVPPLQVACFYRRITAPLRRLLDEVGVQHPVAGPV